MTINLPICDMPKQTVTMPVCNAINLLSDRLDWEIKMWAEEPVDHEDEALGTKEQETNYRIMVRRSAITGIAKNKGDSGKTWTVAVIVPGNGDDLVFYSATEAERDQLFDTLTEWWLNDNV